jgi:hypothetical protein
VNCRKVSHLLSAYIDSELAGVEYRAIREHLAHCHECLSEYEGLLQTKRMLARLRVQAPKNDLPNRILSYIEAETQQTERQRSLSWRDRMHVWFRQSSPVPQAMVMGAVVAGTVLFSLSHTPDQPTDKIQWTQLNPQEIQPLAPVPPDTLSRLTSPSTSAPAMPVVFAPRAHAWPTPSLSYQMVSNERAHSFLTSPFARFNILISSNDYH